MNEHLKRRRCRLLRSVSGVDDMTTLSYLHEPAVVHNLKTRYDFDIIYTYTGTILIASPFFVCFLLPLDLKPSFVAVVVVVVVPFEVNPYRTLPNVYTRQMIEAYCGQPFGKLSPHVYAIAEDAFRSMMNNDESQSILVSGESGA